MSSAIRQRALLLRDGTSNPVRPAAAVDRHQEKLVDEEVRPVVTDAHE
jgi:hypothetical protein